MLEHMRRIASRKHVGSSITALCQPSQLDGRGALAVEGYAECASKDMGLDYSNNGR